VNVGTSVYAVKAEDPDAGGTLEYFFVEPKSAINKGGVQINVANYDYRVRCGGVC
jgi:hypothetical protein